MRKKKLSQRVVEEKADQILVLEANIDDQSAESLAPVLDLLMDNGALDAFFSPIQMKKKSASYQTNGHDSSSRSASHYLSDLETHINRWRALPDNGTHHHATSFYDRHNELW
ncbi:DUF111 family protein [Latilactobacillus sakei]